MRLKIISDKAYPYWLFKTMAELELIKMFIAYSVCIKHNGYISKWEAMIKWEKN
jgi:hypothetical protein